MLLCFFFVGGLASSGGYDGSGGSNDANHGDGDCGVTVEIVLVVVVMVLRNQKNAYSITTLGYNN